MDKISTVQTLARYLNKTYLSESWATEAFKESYAQAAKEAGFDDYTMGVTMSWSDGNPEVVNVSREGISVTKHEFKKLPLQGLLVRKMCQELTALAQLKMVNEVREEREHVLREIARSRVARMIDAPYEEA